MAKVETAVATKLTRQALDDFKVFMVSLPDYCGFAFTSPFLVPTIQCLLFFFFLTLT